MQNGFYLLEGSNAALVLLQQSYPSQRLINPIQVDHGALQINGQTLTVLNQPLLVNGQIWMPDT